MKSDRLSATSDTAMTRRDLVKHLSIASVGLAVTPVPGWPASWFDQDGIIVPLTDVPDPFPGRRGTGPEEFQGQSLAAQDLRELNSWITPVEDFFAVAHHGYPELDRPSDPFSWTFFNLEIPELAAGEHALASQATDTEGRMQPENLDMKRTFWENNELFQGTIMVS